MFTQAHTLSLALLIALGSCASRREGDHPEECRDGADNDRDGAFDCQDDGCANSPDCLLREGDEALECRDGADNDGDGAFDCQDSDCANSPDCDGSPPRDTGGDDSADDSADPADDSTGGDDSTPDDSTPDDSTPDDSGDTGDTTGGSCDDVGAPTGSGAAGVYKRADVVFTFDIMPVDGSLAEDCTMVFKGAARQFKVSTKRVEMCGTWALDSTTCADEAVRAAQSALWWEEGGEGYHTFTFTDEAVDTLDVWVVHKKQGDYAYGSKDKIYFFDLGAPLDGDLKVHHSEGGSISDSGGYYYGEALFTLDVQFHTDG